MATAWSPGCPASSYSSAAAPWAESALPIRRLPSGKHSIISGSRPNGSRCSRKRKAHRLHTHLVGCVEGWSCKTSTWSARGPMTEERLVLAELLEKAGESDVLRAVAEAVLHLLMECDVVGLIGAVRYERSGERTTWRNGYRDRTLDTRLGALQ